MPPKKRTAAPGRRSKRLRTQPPASDLPEREPAEMVRELPAQMQTPQDSGMIQLNIHALTSTIAAAVSEAVKDAMAAQNQASVLPRDTTAAQRVERVVEQEISAITSGTQGANPPIHVSNEHARDQPRQLFTSIGINLGARVSVKIKAKIWANEYIDFGALLSVAPPKEKYAFTMTSNAGTQGKTQLTLEPSQTPRKVTNIQQWLTAFNIFVSVYAEKLPSDASKLMKYCEVVRDLSHKSADWIFYDEQFRYLRQSAPESYPWDQIHWELFLRAMTNFHGRVQSSTRSDKGNLRQRFRPSQKNFPKGTCWAFHAGKYCKGCQYEHVCFKCNARHPASQCQVSATHQRPNGGKQGSPVATSGVGQQTSHARKGGSV